MTLVLASASASRRRMLEAAGVTFTVSAADLNETALTADLQANGADAPAIAQALADQKAITVSRRKPGSLVLGADSVVAFGGELISKCPDLAALKALLRRMADKSHRLISACALARDGTVTWRHVEAAGLTMRRFSDVFLDAYMAAAGEAVLSSVGGYHYEGLGIQLFEKITGDNFTIQGLPMLPLLSQLRAEGMIAT